MATKIDVANLQDRMTTLEERMTTVEEGMATREDLSQFATREDLSLFATREDLSLFATKEDLSLFATVVRGDFEQVHFRFDTLERVMSTRLGQVETDISRLRSVLYLLVKDRPDMLRLLGQPTPGESR